MRRAARGEGPPAVWPPTHAHRLPEHCPSVSLRPRPRATAFERSIEALVWRAKPGAADRPGSDSALQNAAIATLGDHLPFLCTIVILA